MRGWKDSWNSRFKFTLATLTCYAVTNMAGTIKKFYDFTAKLLSGETFSFSALKGKVVLIENVASLWGTTIRDYTQMNELHSRFSAEGLVILGVPCNQFGHQVRKKIQDLKTLCAHFYCLPVFHHALLIMNDPAIKTIFMSKMFLNVLLYCKIANNIIIHSLVTGKTVYCILYFLCIS